MHRHHRLTALSLRIMLVAFGLALLSAASVAAQPQEPQARAGWTFTPSLNFSGGWDDNALLVGVEETSPEDYLTALAPRGALTFLGRRLQMSTAYQGAFIIYRNFSELNSVDQYARADLQYRTTPRTTILVNQSFSKAQTTDAVELVGAPFRRIGHLTSSTGGTVEAQLTARTKLTGGYDLQIVDFDDEAQQFIEFPGGHAHHLAGSLHHRLSPRVTFGGVYDFRRVVVTEGAEIVPIHSSAATADYRVGQRVTLVGSIGVAHLGAGLTHPSRTGATWSAGISGRLRYVELRGDYRRSVVPSFGFGGTFQNEELMASLSGPFGRERGYWQAGLAWRDNDPLVVGPPSTRSLWMSSLVGYAIAPWLRLEGYYNRAHQDTQRPGGRLHRNRIGFQIVTSKPLRLNR
jgi:hypothetical protein